MKKLLNTDNKYSTLKNIFVPVFSFTALLVIWEIAVRISATPNWILPSPTNIAIEFWQIKKLIWYHLVPTMIEALVGLLIATIIGISCAIAMEWSQTVRRILHPLLVISQTIPTIAIAPLLIIWFGFGLMAKIIIISLVCFFPVAINMSEGFRTVNQEWLKIFRTMGASQWQTFRFVKIKAVLPEFFSGLKIAGAYSILGAVVSEWFSAEKGLGILLMRSTKSFQTERVFVAIVVIAILSLCLVKCISIIANLSIPWHKKIN